MTESEDIAKAAEARAKILEGVDFIETEEDAEAVESAVVKIQSTFRGKKIRSKLGQKPATGSEAAPEKKVDSKVTNSCSSGSSSSKANSSGKQCARSESEELSNKVSGMQVNDKSDEGRKLPVAENNTPPEEAERAATKIQAGFKGYKTRKELEGKLAGQLVCNAEEQQSEKGKGS